MSEVELCTPELFPSLIIRAEQQKEFKLSRILVFSSSSQSYSSSLIDKDRHREGGRGKSTTEQTLSQPRGTRPQPVWTNTRHCLIRSSAASSLHHIGQASLRHKAPSLQLSQALAHNRSIEERYESYITWRPF